MATVVKSTKTANTASRNLGALRRFEGLGIEKEPLTP
jgi:hypothetical protein